MLNVNIANIAGGALVEQANMEIQKVLSNILDPNTIAEKKRKVVITLIFDPDEERDVTDVSFQTKSVLIPPKSIKTRIAFEKDGGQVFAEELKLGAIQGQHEISSDGEIIEPKTSNKVVNIK